MQETTNNQYNEITEIAKEIISTGRNVLTLNFRFMDSAISRLDVLFLPATNIGTIMTDGESIVCNPVYVIKRYKKEQTVAARMLMHEILHCVFKHFFVDLKIKSEYWDLASDIAVENVINGFNLESLAYSRQAEEEKVIAELKKDVIFLTAEHIYRYLTNNPPSEEEMQRLAEIFSCDDHINWYMREAAPSQSGQTGQGGQDGQNKQNGQSGQDNSESNSNGNGERNKESKGLSERERQELSETWDKVANSIKNDLETFSKERGDKASDMMQNLKEVTREKYDYTEFLKKFAVNTEVMKINDDEFDYIFYTYGLSLYKRVPLIEPLEYKDEKRVREFVIAIDTSGSTYGELVQAFLQKTYNVLKQSESFASRVNVHIVQCDAEVQEDTKITNDSEFSQYIKDFKIKGGGGTDFCPVFRHVDEMIKNKEFINLRGMIYFTDGNGIFPQKQPDYKTAFVFIDDEYNNYDVPVWAIKLVLKKDEI